MCPIPQLSNNEKFAYFFRPYNYKVHTRKFMNFEALKDESDDEQKPKEETPMTFDYVMLKEKLRREKEKLKKIEEAQNQQKKMNEKEKKKSQTVKPTSSKEKEKPDKKDEVA